MSDSSLRGQCRWYGSPQFAETRLRIHRNRFAGSAAAWELEMRSRVATAVLLTTVATACRYDGSTESPESRTAAERALALFEAPEVGRPLFSGELKRLGTTGVLSLPEVRRIRESLSAEGSAADGCLQARLRAARRDFEGALAALQEASASSDSCVIDRSAIFLERYRLEGDPSDAVRALGALPRHHESPEGSYNRWLSLEALGLHRVAERERLAFEARGEERLAALALKVKRTAAPPATVTHMNSELEEPNLELAQRSLASGDSMPLRRWIERVGIREMLSGDSVDASRLSELAVALERPTRDGLPRLLVEDLVKSEKGGAIWRAAGLWLEGERSYSRRNPEEALARFLAGQGELKSVETAWQTRLELSIAACRFQLQQYDDSIALSQRLEARARVENWFDVQGRAKWLEGLSRLQSGYPALAASSLQQAAAAFERAIEPGLQGNVMGIESDAWSSLGDFNRALTLRLESLGRIRKAGLLGREETALEAAGEGLRKAEHFVASLEFLAEAELVLGSERDALTLAEQGLRRAAVLLEIGEATEALRVANQALKDSSSIESTALRERTAAGIRAQIGAATVEVDPKRAEMELSGAIDARAPHGFFQRRSELLLARARAKAKLGETLEAERDLLAAIEDVEAGSRGIKQRFERALYFEIKRRIVDEAVNLLTQTGDAHGALAWAVDRAERAPRRSNPGAPQCSRAFAGDLALWALPDRLVRWRCSGVGLEMDSIPISRRELGRKIQAFRRQMFSNQDANELSAQLFDLLLEPAREQLGAGVDLVVVLDGALFSIPFAALRDRVSGRWTAEMAEIIVANPQRRSERDGESVGSKVLLVAAPELGVEASASFPPLKGARLEAESIKAALPGVSLLEGSDATKSMVLEELRAASLVHVAAHATADVDDPRGSAVLLAGEGAQGLLTASEVAGLDLPLLELAVLSACDSGSGFTTSSSGPLSLANAFLEAGAERVVASHWKVDDEASAEFFATFYEQLRIGATVSRALALARREFLTDPGRAASLQSVWANYFLSTRGEETSEGKR